MKIVRLSLLFFLMLVLPAAVPAQSGSFGKNKVQYSDFNWSFIQSSHFDIYFADNGEYIAQFTAEAAESAYQSIASSFRYQITNRIPFVVYNSHNEFQQTNVISEYLEEGIGGVTELFKNRVVVPFEGDYAKFRHVIHHELVHAVINDMFYGGSIQSIISNNITLQLPLWFNEGLAEYEALRWESNSDMFLRDATVQEYLPPIKMLDGYFAYRGGQSVWYYIESKYGKEKIGDILLRIRGTRSVDQGFRSTIGLTVEELSERWQKEQKILYWPDIAKREDPTDYARRLTDHTKDGSFYNTSPSISPQGDRIAFISNRDDYFDVFVMNAIDGSTVDKVVSGQRTADFEELHLLTPGMSWSPDGKRLALAAKSGGSDAIILIDIDGGAEEKIEPGLTGIFSVDWSPTGTALAFIGTTASASDVYVFDLQSRTLTNLTNDVYSDSDPTWSPDGKSLFFCSNRMDDTTTGYFPPRYALANHTFRQTDIYRIDVNSRAISRAVDLPESEESSPTVAPDGRHLLFISDRNGINNIYLQDLDSSTIRPVTNSLTGVYQLSLSRDGKKLAFGSFLKGGFDIFLLRTPLERRMTTAELEPTEYIKRLSARNSAIAVADSALTQFPLSEDVVITTGGEDTTATREQSAGLDLRNYVFSDVYNNQSDKRLDTLEVLPASKTMDDSGRYIVNKYKLNFSPDIVYGTAGYNTFYGVQGSTIMAFSDMLGNHQIYLLTNLQFDLKNSDYAAAYLYLTKRIDYGIQGFHSARFVVLQDDYGSEYLYRFRNYGLTLVATYPLDRFYRLDFGLSWTTISKDNLDNTIDASEKFTLVNPTVSFVHDTALWGLISPSNGVRYNISLTSSPKIGGQALDFQIATLDYRRYLRLWKNYTLAVRCAGGVSFGHDPQHFIVGGVENWINRKFEGDRFPIQRASDFVFLTTGTPLRGYNYASAVGTKYGLLNVELRFPFFGYVAAGPVPVFLQSLGGVFFVDLGAAWTDADQFKGVDTRPDGTTYMRDLLAGTGYGVRMVVLGFLLKLDVAWSYDIAGFSRPKYYFSLGPDF